MRISTNQLYQRSINNIIAQQEKLSRLDQELSNNRRVQSPSDDPIAAAQIELMSHRLKSSEVYKSNIQSANSKLKIEEDVLTGVKTALQRLREIQVQAGNSALSDSDRKTLANEAQNLLNQLQDYANFKDNDGYYMFSGSRSASAAISLMNGQYVYNGDSTLRLQQISDSMQVAINDTGDNIFMRIPQGNGVFTVRQTATPNTGTAIASTGSVINPSSYIPDNYTLTFAQNSQGKTVVMVSGATTGNVLPPTGLPDDAPVYQDGASITFNGMEIKISGEPQLGDSFLISPAQNSSMFATVQQMITALTQSHATSADKASIGTINNQLMAQIDSALNRVLDVQSDIGSRMNLLESAENANDNLIEVSSEVLKQLREINPVVVAAEYNAQIYNLQIAQQSFSRIQGLSIFNYI
jgi:flagellar hook-associated protein 3 FlgL